MIAVSPTLAHAMLLGPGLVPALGSAATVAVFGTARPSAGGAPVSAAQCTLQLATTPGTWDNASGGLLIAPSGDGQLITTGAPKWARVYSTAGDWMFDCDARLDADPDNGEELVVMAPALYPGAFVRVSGGVLYI